MDTDGFIPDGFYFRDDLDGGRLIKKETAMKLCHDDLCRLSRAFNEAAQLSMTQDGRINEWLKEKIAKAKRREECEQQSFDDLEASGGIVGAP